MSWRVYSYSATSGMWRWLLIVAGEKSTRTPRSIAQWNWIFPWGSCKIRGPRQWRLVSFREWFVAIFFSLFVLQCNDCQGCQEVWTWLAANIYDFVNILHFFGRVSCISWLGSDSFAFWCHGNWLRALALLLITYHLWFILQHYFHHLTKKDPLACCS